MPHVPASVRRPAVVQAAITLMADRGAANVTTRDIAKAAGVPQATLHYLFGSRDELLRAVIEQVTAEVCERIAGATATGESLQAVLASVVAELVRGVKDEPDLHLLLLELTILALRHPDLRELATWQYSQYEAASMTVLAKICQQSHTEFIGDPAVTIRLVLALLDGITVQQLVDGDSKHAGAGLEALAATMAGHFVPSRTA